MRYHSLLRPVLVSAALTTPFCATAADRAAAAEIPPYFKQLIAQGNVEFEFYDSRGQWRRYPGQAIFLIFLDHRYRFRYDFTEQGGSLHLEIRPDMRKVECGINHKIRLPDRFDSDRRWGHWLVAHEFDHVAISTDPRAVMLLEHLLKKLPLIRRTVGVEETIDARFVDRIVNEEIVRRRDAVERLIQSNYDLLDQITRHGVRPLPDRAVFFKSLYTKANLQQMHFPYRAEVADLLTDRVYRNAKLLYAFHIVSSPHGS